MRKVIAAAVVASLCPFLTISATQSQLPPAATRAVDYVADVKPLLQQNC